MSTSHDSILTSKGWSLRGSQGASICIYTTQEAHLLWDQVAELDNVPTHNAIRLLDTRERSRPSAGSTTRVRASSSGVRTVIANLTVVDASAPGYTTAYPCSDGRPIASNNNYVTGETTPNLAVLRTDANGDICIYTTQEAHLLWDQVAELDNVPTHNATRLLDTRERS